MIVKAIYEPDFGDKTTGNTYENQIKRKKGDIFECDNKLAKDRIKKGFVVEASDEEKEAYKKQQETLLKAQVDDKDLEKGKVEGDSDKTSQTGDESNDTTKALEECTIDELIGIANNENIELHYPKDETAKDVIIETINKVRTERLNQPVVE